MLNESPFFSILIPAYNVEKYIRRCLLSVTSQSFDDYEIIIVDDGSSDNTLEMIRECAEKNDKIHVVSHKNNQGLLCARITAMNLAQGKYVILLDSDDYISEDSLEKLHNEIKRISNDSIAVDIFGLKYIVEPQEEVIEIGDSLESGGQGILQYTIPPTVWNKVYSIELINRMLQIISPFRCTLAEDVFFSSILLSLAKHVEYLDVIVHHYSSDTGVTAKRKQISKEEIEAKIVSIENIKYQFELLEKRKELAFLPIVFSQENIDICVKKTVEYCYRISSTPQTESKSRLMCAIMLDEHFGTNFSEQLVDKADGMDEYLGKSYFKKIGFLFGQIVYWTNNKVRSKVIGRK